MTAPPRGTGSRKPEADIERLWFKIGEASELVGASPKELRYWEDRIPEIRPRRSQGKLRYYHRDELPRLLQIKAWLAEGLTVLDCRQLMLHGHLTPRLDLGLDPEEQPSQPVSKGRKALPLRPLPIPVQAAMPAPDLEPLKAALRELIERLSRPTPLP
ncbi:MAG TPA: MerR family transcriptional regulator [Holophagaceae bacterium]|jgi:DNA-binding transcriptional MerR regulator|nr:MerR family transcriptional regulator [Holophagaceae bacterium]